MTPLNVCNGSRLDRSNSSANAEKEGENCYQSDAAYSTLGYGPCFATPPQHSHGNHAKNNQQWEAESPSHLANTWVTWDASVSYTPD